MTLIPVIIKRSRIHHSFKYWGGLLNPSVKGDRQGYYTRRVTAKTNPLVQLTAIRNNNEQAA